MILIIGGVYQGKLAFAKSRFSIHEEEVCDLNGAFVPGKRCYIHTGAAVRRGESLPFPADAVVIAEETGSGVVPMDPEERRFREAEGLLLQRLALESDEVWRVLCGIGTRIR